MPQFLSRIPPLPATLVVILAVAAADHSPAGPAHRWSIASVPPLLAAAGATVLAARADTFRGLLIPVGAIAAAASIAVTAAAIPFPQAIGSSDGTWLYTETALLLGLLACTVRWLPGVGGRVLAAALALADAALDLRFRPLGTLSEALAGCLFWSLGAIAAIVFGRYLRILEFHKHRAVAATRRAERLEFARDLHDFVAHHISGIVVQAQAAQLIAATDPERTAAALRRIEDAGSQALESMRATVTMLRDVDRPGPGLPQVRELVQRFGSAGTARATLTADDRIPPHPEIGSTVYRVVQESLTNTLRHAPSASLVDVHIRSVDGPDFPGIEVLVTDDGTGGPPCGPRNGGGFGLTGLEERLGALGGTFSAGRRPGGGWQVRALLPCSVPTGGSAAALHGAGNSR